jgi:hypothetical protein
LSDDTAIRSNDVNGLMVLTSVFVLYALLAVVGSMASAPTHGDAHFLSTLRALGRWIPGPTDVHRHRCRGSRAATISLGIKHGHRADPPG